MPAESIVQTDGQKCAEHRDPPGQFTIYIPSGDTWKESYRAVTFRDFPQDTPVNPRILASSGFFYTGYKDRVKCFSCSTSIENWIVGDDPTEKKWHRGDCDFANGHDRTNEPILGIYKRYLAGSSGSGNLPSLSGQVSSNNERSGVRQNVTISTYGATNAIPNRGNSRQPQLTSGTESAHEVQSPMDVDYPCRHPVNPHMRSPVARLETFKPTLTVRWPRERLRAGINEITSAGFFYMGEGDRVKCWYCNGGLQNWDYDDDPWTEHAKWFPSCEFLLRIKGPQFVQGIVDQYPNINRPTPTVRVVRRTDVNSSPSPSNNVSHPQSAEEAVENAMRNHSYVAEAREAGFSEDTIKTVLMRKHNSDGQLYVSTNEFFNALTNYQQEVHETSQLRSSPAPQPTPSLPQARPQVTTEAASNSSMLSELRSMEQSRLCKICRKEPSNVVLVPCGHLACCSGCSTEELRRCPVCHRGIQEKLKAFRS